MTSKRRYWGGNAGRRCVQGFALLIALGCLLSGCLTDAQDKGFKYDNENDTTPKGGSDSETGVSIAYVDTFDKIVVIVNASTLELDMDGWRLTNNGSDEDTLEAYDFVAFVLDSGAFVRVHSDTGTETNSDLYSGVENEPDWGNGSTNDRAILLNAEGSPVTNCEDGDACWQ